jgi:hypothetical protein
VVYLEDLQVRNMVRNHHLATSISDAAWRQFRTIRDAKAACAGRQVIAVPVQYTTQDCSGVLPDGSRCLAASSQEPVGAHPAYPRLTSVRRMGWCSTATRMRRRLCCGPGRPVRRKRGRLGRASSEQSLA